MKRIIIVAIAENRGIGKDNDLLWSLPDDMKFFKTQTTGRPVVMGRKNFESIPHKYRPLPNRENIVLTRNPSYQAPGARIFGNLESSLQALEEEGNEEAYIIGGGEIYKIAIEQNLVDIMYITEVHRAFEADAFFPRFDENEWDVEIIENHPEDDMHAYAFTIKKLTKRSVEKPFID